jgi:DNA-binding XRE family transcriptional regulator
MQTTFNREKLLKDFIKTRADKESQNNCTYSFSNIALELGIYRESIYRLLHKSEQPKYTTVAALCKWMGKSLDEYYL